MRISPHIKFARETPRSRRHVSQHLLQEDYPAFQRGLADSSVLDVEINCLLHALLYVLHSSWCWLVAPCTVPAWASTLSCHFCAKQFPANQYSQLSHLFKHQSSTSTRQTLSRCLSTACLITVLPGSLTCLATSPSTKHG